MEETTNIKQLREDCLILMVQKGYSKMGGQKTLAKELKKNRNSISMALTGYRNGPGSEQILNEIKEHLQAKA